LLLKFLSPRFLDLNNIWIKQPGFYPLVEKVWQQQVAAKSSSARISAKFKSLRYELKKWGKYFHI
jgi:hypothetical protein